jgi:hypothetical protein
MTDALNGSDLETVWLSVSQRARSMPLVRVVESDDWRAAVLTNEEKNGRQRFLISKQT